MPLVLGRAWSWGVIHFNNRSRLSSRWFRKTETWTPSEVHGQICSVSSLEFMVRVTFNLRSLGGKSFPRMLLHVSRAKTQTFKQPSSIPQDTQCLSDFPAAGCLPSSSPLYTTTVSTVKVSQVPAPHAGSIRILSLNRPSARNAISKQLLSELRQQVEEISNEPEDGPTRALILASESDQAFCAGADLKERLTMSGDE